jgi:hypothetical protein
MIHTKPIIFAASLMLVAVSACQDNSSSTGPAPAVTEAVDAVPSVAATATASPGKPTAPIDISYEIVGNAIVGSPVMINIVVTSDYGPVNVEYSIVDNSALMFQSGQVERREVLDPSSRSVQQLSVIPQREGRVYVNVSADIPTVDGLNIRSMSIPIQVGSAPEQPADNGEMVEGPGGEVVNSLPAQESN